MAFAQLTYRESLRDIETCLRSIGSKLYPMGFRSTIARSTLADANESRDWRIDADFAQVLIAIARPLYAHDPIGVELNQKFVRSGFDHHRSLPLPVSLGQVSPAQSGSEDAYAAGPAWQYPHALSALPTAKCTTSTFWTTFFPRPVRSMFWNVKFPKNVEWARQGPENCGLLALDACPIKHKAPVEHESFVGYFVSLPRPVFRYHW